VVAIMSGAMAKLRASDVIDRALKEGAAAPQFELPDATGQTVSLQQRLADGPAVVTFYRGVW
jgi:peroxiredoxin